MAYMDFNNRGNFNVGGDIMKAYIIPCILTIAATATFDKANKIHNTLKPAKYAENCMSDKWCKAATKHVEAFEIMEQQRLRFIELEDKCYEKKIVRDELCITWASNELEKEGEE